ncbi:MAG TPA: hypothetical protein PKW35_06805 [Nannocystaceae bacterium]|nr:hypothetical protein [Nannocystaceae bacterium]
MNKISHLIRCDKPPGRLASARTANPAWCGPAAKGSGFLRGHPAGRWAQQALFFLVWSVPNAVIDAELERIAVDDP